VSEQIATVIGGQGFIGRALVERLRELGWECWVPGRSVNWPQTDRPLGRVFYCAGMTADYLRDPAATLEAHAGLLSRVLQSRSYESLVYLSSTRLYDGFLSSEEVAREDGGLSINPLDPRHLYDVTKLAGESLCHVLGQGRARVARLSCVYNDEKEENGFLAELLKKVANTRSNEVLHIASSPHYCRDYVHVSDVVRALIDIAQHGIQPVYNVASGQNLRNDALAAIVKAHSARRIVFDLDRAQSPPALVSIQRLQSEFGWNPELVESRIAPWLQSLSLTP
jgi:nucleoside-diphosphate-sugar epimerase